MGFTAELRTLINTLHKGRGLFITTTDDGNDEDNNEKLESLHHLLEQLGIPIYQLHASGHADCHDIIDLIEKIHPEMVIPIHSEKPEIFEKLFEASDIKVQNLLKYDIFNV